MASDRRSTPKNAFLESSLYLSTVACLQAVAYHPFPAAALATVLELPPMVSILWPSISLEIGSMFRERWLPFKPWMLCKRPFDGK